MASAGEVKDDRQQNPEAKNPNITLLQLQLQNPDYTWHNTQSLQTLDDPGDEDVVMIGSASDLNRGEERRDFEGVGLDREVMGGGVENFVGFEDQGMRERIRVFDGKKVLGENENGKVMRRCNGFDGVQSVDFEGEKGIQEVEDGEEDEEEEDPEDEDEDDDEEEEDDEKGEDFSLAMQGEASHNTLFPGIETMQVSYSNLFDPTVQSNSIHGNSSQFFNGNVNVHSNKRMASSSENRVLSSNKRMRIGGSDFDMRGGGSDFNMCMEQMQHWMSKTRSMYMEKEQACAEASMNQQVIYEELHKRQVESQQLQATIHRMQQNRQAEVYRYENELHHMVNLVKGYRDALQDTKRKFMDYKERVESAQLNQSLHKDVSEGEGEGLVAGAAELEKQPLKEKEEEERKSKVEKIFKDFEDECMLKFEEHKSSLELLNTRLLALEDQIEQGRELIAKQKVEKSSKHQPSA